MNEAPALAVRGLVCPLLGLLLLLSACGGAADSLESDSLSTANATPEARATDSRPTPVQTPTPTESSSSSSVAHVVVLQLGGDPYGSSGYSRIQRTAADADTPERQLQYAMSQLVRGVTREESRQGLASVFTEKTADVLQGVALDEGGRATIDFARLEAIPQVGTTQGGTAFYAQVVGTVFAVSQVQSVELQLRGSCEALYEMLQQECEIVTRSNWEASSPLGAS